MLFTACQFRTPTRCEECPAKRSNSIIDISHYNGTRLRFDKAKADGIVDVIQKATRGESYVDATTPAGDLFPCGHRNLVIQK
jgi:GH25 family lysozyme M1 (1,4-beta-N-acetylmuramidase)